MPREDRPPTVLIRPATATDIPAFLEVMSVAFGVPNRRPSVHTWAFEQADGHLLGAERDGRAVAGRARAAEAHQAESLPELPAQLDFQVGDLFSLVTHRGRAAQHHVRPQVEG